MTKTTIIGALIALQSPAAFAGSYGSYQQSYPGFTLWADISAGAMSGPNAGQAEQQFMHYRRQEAKKGFVAASAKVIAALKHYRGGRHPYRGLAHHLSSKKVTALPKAVARSGLVFIKGPILSYRVQLHLKRKLPESVRRRLARDFALAQIWPGGIAHGIAIKPWERRGTDTFRAALGFLRRVNGNALRFAIAHRDMLRKLLASAGGPSMRNRWIIERWLDALPPPPGIKRRKRAFDKLVSRAKQADRNRYVELIDLLLHLTPTKQLVRALAKLGQEPQAGRLKQIVAAIK